MLKIGGFVACFEGSGAKSLRQCCRSWRAGLALGFRHGDIMRQPGWGWVVKLLFTKAKIVVIGGTMFVGGVFFCWFHTVAAEPDCRIDTAVTCVGRLKIETNIVDGDTFMGVSRVAFLGRNRSFDAVGWGGSLPE